MAFVAPMAAAGVAGAEGAAAAGGGAAVAGTAGRGAAGKAASRTASRAGGKAGSSRAAAAGGAAGSSTSSTSTSSTPRRRRTTAERYDDRQTSGGGSTAVTPATEDSRTIGEQLDAPSQAVDEAVKNSRAYVAAQKARPSQQVAGGLLAALVVYPILLNFLQGGSPQVKRWLKAKAFNVTSTPGAASTTVKPKRNPSSGGNIGNAGMTSGTGATSPPVGSSSSTGSAAGTAIAFARSKIGLPYGWGKAGPDAYDCSGLTSKAYAAAGISIGRTTLQQIFAGTEVKRADLQPGDLVFAHPRHVAIYTGNGRIVEAPRTGLNVREVPIWGFWRARRVT
jgi:cell wall-associated NlpC family hydrolase